MSTLIIKKKQVKSSALKEFYRNYKTVNLSKEEHALIKKLSRESGLSIRDLLVMMIHFSLENMEIKEDIA